MKFMLRSVLASLTALASVIAGGDASAQTFQGWSFNPQFGPVNDSIGPTYAQWSSHPPGAFFWELSPNSTSSPYYMPAPGMFWVDTTGEIFSDPAPTAAGQYWIPQLVTPDIYTLFGCSGGVCNQNANCTPELCQPGALYETIGVIDAQNWPSFEDLTSYPAQETVNFHIATNKTDMSPPLNLFWHLGGNSLPSPATNCENLIYIAINYQDPYIGVASIHHVTCNADLYDSWAPVPASSFGNVLAIGEGYIGLSGWCKAIGGAGHSQTVAINIGLVGKVQYVYQGNSQSYPVTAATGGVANIPPTQPDESVTVNCLAN